MNLHLPIVALIGRPNVGKSTLFNRLAKKRVSITHDMPGVTRDSILVEIRGETKPYALVDTGGIIPDSTDAIELDIFEQAREAMASADVILFVVDGRVGLHPQDEHVAQFLRQSGKPVHLVINKVDGPEQEDTLAAEFYALGFPLLCVSAEHGFGMRELRHCIEEELPVPDQCATEIQEPGLKIALLGRPNAGKSSTINALLGSKRLIVSPEAGTTRDCVDVVITRGKNRYVFVDTAGVRRKSKVTDSLEYFSVVHALHAAKSADVVILVLDVTTGVVGQDKRLLSFLDEEKIPFIILVNKTDLLSKEDVQAAKKGLTEQVAFCGHVPVLFSSTVSMAGLGGLLPLVEKLWAQCAQRVSTGELNRLVRLITERHQPPVVGGRRGKIYYMTQADSKPPTFVFFVNDDKLFQGSYIRYLENQLRKVFGMDKTPIRMVFRSSHKNDG